MDTSIMTQELKYFLTPEFYHHLYFKTKEAADTHEAVVAYLYNHYKKDIEYKKWYNSVSAGGGTKKIIKIQKGLNTPA